VIEHDQALPAERPSARDLSVEVHVAKAGLNDPVEPVLVAQNVVELGFPGLATDLQEQAHASVRKLAVRRDGYAGPVAPPVAMRPAQLLEADPGFACEPRDDPELHHVEGTQVQLALELWQLGRPKRGIFTAGRPLAAEPATHYRRWQREQMRSLSRGIEADPQPIGASVHGHAPEVRRSAACVPERDHRLLTPGQASFPLRNTGIQSWRFTSPAKNSSSGRDEPLQRWPRAGWTLCCCSSRRAYQNAGSEALLTLC
jgi:hypothetical protein